jgi:hypothetical protein
MLRLGCIKLPADLPAFSQVSTAESSADRVATVSASPAPPCSQWLRSGKSSRLSCLERAHKQPHRPEAPCS